MAINKLNVGLIDNVSATGNTQVSDGHILTYVAANNAVEFKNLDLTVTGTGTVSSNIESINTSVTGDIDTVQDNISSTTTLVTSTETNIDTVQSNLDTFATYANTNYASDAANSFSTVTVSDANLVATSSSDNLTFISGNGISISANAAAQSLTFDVYAGNIKSDYFVLDGTANTCTLSTSDRPNTYIYVTVGGLIQEAGINYVVSGETLTLINTYPIINGTDVEVRYLPYTGETPPPPPPPYSFQGDTYLYAFGAINQPASSPSPSDVIERIVIASDTNATDVGETHAAGLYAGGATHSNDEAYSLLNSSGSSMVARKFPFASATEVAQNVTLGGGGNKSGGSDGTNGYYVKNSIFKFPFAAGTPRTTVGSLTLGRSTTATSVSSTHGYISGGRGNFPYANSDVIEKFPYTSDTNASDVGELSTDSFKTTSGSSSTTHGYVMGGEQFNGGNRTNIDKFPFASDSPSSNPFNGAKMMGFGGSSETHGYFAGGASNNNSGSSGIVKFPYSSDTATSSVGNLTQAKRQGDAGGEQMAND